MYESKNRLSSHTFDAISGNTIRCIDHRHELIPQWRSIGLPPSRGSAGEIPDMSNDIETLFQNLDGSRHYHGKFFLRGVPKILIMAIAMMPPDCPRGCVAMGDLDTDVGDGIPNCIIIIHIVEWAHIDLGRDLDIPIPMVMPWVAHETGTDDKPIEHRPPQTDVTVGIDMHRIDLRGVCHDRHDIPINVTPMIRMDDRVTDRLDKIH